MDHTMPLRELFIKFFVILRRKEKGKEGENEHDREHEGARELRIPLRKTRGSLPLSEKVFHKI
jgi:hypothetical protein